MSYNYRISIGIMSFLLSLAVLNYTSADQMIYFDVSDFDPKLSVAEFL